MRFIPSPTRFLRRWALYVSRRQSTSWSGIICVGGLYGLPDLQLRFKLGLGLARFATVLLDGLALHSLFDLPTHEHLAPYLLCPTLLVFVIPSWS